MASEFDYKILDEVFHSRIRLAVVSVLVSVGEADFVFIRDAVGTTDGNLSTHLRKLEEAGYVDVEKSFIGRKPASRYRLSKKGHSTFETYVANLANFLKR